MTRIFLIFVLGVLLTACGSSKVVQNDLATAIPISTAINLSEVVNDKAPVMINPGRFTQDTVVYRMPKVIQGFYEVSDFGKFIEDFKAYDYNGNEMATIKQDVNSWAIANATQLDEIKYWVNDTYDQEKSGRFSSNEIPFSPGGTNIEADNYVLNLHGFIGYFDSLKDAQYTLNVTAPTHFERTSALQETSSKISVDGTQKTTSYFAPRYFDITDNPMMYGELDVEEFMVGDIKIVLSVYSPNKVHTATSLKETVYKMMKAQKSYLGDIDSTSRYDIYLYLSDESADAPRGFGALEHHTSTVVVLRERYNKEELAASVIDVVAHEFFHIVTPLTVHSEDVHYFDYNDPSFSKHLWMYEGVTEYFAQHFQVYEGLVDIQTYLTTIEKEINYAKYYDDTMSFTEMSEKIISQPYAANYANVYQKGALIGMCLDILLREESHGNRSMLSLMKELSHIYGIEKPFEDDTLIEEITAMTYPSVGVFLKTHVVGGTPIDYNTFFDKVGVHKADLQVECLYMESGEGVILEADKDNRTVFFNDAVKGNSFWVEQGVLANDVLLSVNRIKIIPENANTMIQHMYNWEPGDDIEVVIERNGKTMDIKTKLTKAFTTVKALTINKNATEAQVKLRNAWLHK
ncbi:peptidase M61 [Psychroserpens algicola]|uniref:Peptidase M61 n=1 Tax=Psychroserpens algicola TaxID=1719034 RepID=A0ABT0HA20_9FLAO|nr:peptidase M61 [Psychroserpens algicola]MCK8480685.1 peptidase M61 [Psychroserpens algicola]